MFYDPAQAAGCVLCVREREQQAAASAGGRRSLGLLLAAMVVAGAALATLGAPRLREWLVGRPPSEPALASAEARSSKRRVAPARPLRVLFVGNGLTSQNDLPGMIQKLAASAGERPFEPSAVVFEGFALSQHLAANRAKSALTSGGPWDAVVLQEQGQRPGWPAERERDFFASVRALDTAIRSAGARTVLYDTLARRDGDETVAGDGYDAMQARVDEGYAAIGRALRAEVVPVGALGRNLIAQRPSFALWQSDGQSPSVAGSYLAACAFYAAFYARSPVGNAFRAGLSDEEALVLQRAAAAASATDELERAAGRPSARPLAAQEARGTGVVAAQKPAPPQAAARDVETQEAQVDRLRHERIAADIRAREAELERLRRSRLDEAVFAGDAHAGRLRVPVAMYKTSWCGACKRASAYMQREGIPVREYDIEEDPEARARARQLNPRGTIPTIDIDGDVLVGWSQARFEAMLAQAAARRAR